MYVYFSNGLLHFREFLKHKKKLSQRAYFLFLGIEFLKDINKLIIKMAGVNIKSDIYPKIKNQLTFLQITKSSSNQLFKIKLVSG